MLELALDLNDFCCKTDEELAVLAKNDKAAAGVLISRYSKLIFIKSKIYAISDTDCEDLHQEGFMSLLKAINAYDPAKNVKFSTFAEVCIVNRMKTSAARMRRNMRDGERVDEDEAADMLSVEENPESIFLYKEFFSEMLGSIDSVLSPAELRTFRLCMQGMTYKQAALELGVTEKSVDNAMQRARKKIRALYQQRKDN